MSKARLTTGIAVALGLQLRFALNGSGERDRRGWILRHQFAQAVDLPVRHLQHAADVAQYRPRACSVPKVMICATWSRP